MKNKNFILTTSDCDPIKNIKRKHFHLTVHLEAKLHTQLLQHKHTNPIFHTFQIKKKKNGLILHPRLIVDF